MSSDPKVLTNYLHVNSAWNFAIYRSFLRFKDPNIIKNDHLRILINSSHDVAVIQWCSLFGSCKKTNPTHWLRCKEPWIKDKSDFIQRILNPIDLSFENWTTYHSELLNYRNKNIAHIEINDWYRNIPNLDIALKVLFQSYRIFTSDTSSSYALQIEFDKIQEGTNNLLLSLGFKEQD